MNQIYEIAFSYYTVFYSYKGKFFDVWPWMMSSSLTGGGFIYFVWIGLPDLGKFNEEPMLFFFNMLYMVVFEGLFIFSFYKLKDTRDKLLTIEYQHYRKEMQLVLAKRNWILAKINKSEGEYLEFVKEIRDIQNLHKIYAGESENWLKFLFKSIYSSESKTRITSYLIFLFSLISLLTLKGIEDISELLPIYTDLSYQKIIVSFFIISTFSFVIWLGLIRIIKFLFDIININFYVLISNKRGTYRFVEVFVGDLVTLHRLPKIIFKEHITN